MDAGQEGIDEHALEDTMTVVLPSRRALLAAAAAFVASGAKVEAASAVDVPSTEGFFFVHRDTKDSGDAIDRIFFLKSTWLSYFEITDKYPDKAVKGKVVDMIKGGGRWNVLYSDQIPANQIKSEASSVDVPAPQTTYLAMMITP